MKRKKILLLASAFNGFTQKAYTSLAPDHDTYVDLSLSEEYMREQIGKIQPDLIICPFLKDRIPEDIWRKYLCIIIHPGIIGDRGPSSLDWAISQNLSKWGVTALEASEDMDAGDIWATREFDLPERRKSFVYNKLVAVHGLSVIDEVVEKFCQGQFKPTPLSSLQGQCLGELRPLMKQSDRKINWSTDSSKDIVRKINAADGFPGVLDSLFEQEVFLFGASCLDEAFHQVCQGFRPGTVVAKHHESVCLASIDGGVWVSHLKKKKQGAESHFKQPASLLLKDQLMNVPDIFDLATYPQPVPTGADDTFYEEANQIGYLRFDFYNGAMSTSQCHRLAEQLELALNADTKALVLRGGEVFWSNGINLNTIEAAEHPASEAWDNINAMDDVIELILRATHKPVLAFVDGNAGAGGVFLAMACDRVYLKDTVILNPHYKTMGLFGSEFWTLTLQERLGNAEEAKTLVEKCLPMNAQESLRRNLVDGVFDDFDAFNAQIKQVMLDGESIKQSKKLRLEAVDLDRIRSAELAQMRENFFEDSLGFTKKRHNFVYKRKPKSFCLGEKIVKQCRSVSR